MAWEDIERSKGNAGQGRGPADPNEVIVVKGKPTPNKKGKARKDVIRIYVGENVLREARYVIGDYILPRVELDEPHHLCLLTRVHESAPNKWKLLPTSNKQKGRKTKGQFARGYLTFTPKTQRQMEGFFPNGQERYEAKNISVREEGILFDLP